MDEKRKTERKAMEGDLHIYSNDGARPVGNGRVLDLSEGGMRIASGSDLSIGERFSMHFSIPLSWDLDFFGNIVYKHPVDGTATYGVQFLEGQDTYILKLLASARSGSSGYLAS
jgi:hypothetical protein